MDSRLNKKAARVKYNLSAERYHVKISLIYFPKLDGIGKNC